MNRANRLVRDAEFRAVRRGGKSWTVPAVVLIGKPNQLGISRVGFSVSKRLGNAVVRNRLKRRLREIFRARWSRLRPGWDLVVIGRLPSVDLDYWELASAIDNVLNRARLPREGNGP